jgi:glucose-6-phosphate isomerase
LSTVGSLAGSLTELEEWNNLFSHYQTLSPKTSIDTLLQEDSFRVERYCSTIGEVSVDYSKNCFNDATLYLLERLAQRLNIKNYIEHIFQCKKVNWSEQRKVLHAALRSPELFIGSNFNDIKKEINLCREKMDWIATKVRANQWLGSTGKPIRTIVNIGIGGSDLGPKLVVDALKPYADSMLQIDFVSNIDPWHISSILSKLNPEETLFIICSKTFTTLETLTNAKRAFSWLGSEYAIQQQCIAVTENQDKACEFGINPNHILPVWDWLGGRFSLWSAIGLSIILSIGIDGFEELLHGARLVDHHVFNTNYQDNIPLRLALLDLWYANFFNCPTRAIITYSEQLKNFVPYCQQLMMESNGKSVDINQKAVTYSTCPIIWGGVGTNSQHAFHQLLMQGTHHIPVDFIIPKHSSIKENKEQHQQLVQQLKAQSKALTYGTGIEEQDINKKIPGSKPHTIFTLDAITPKCLGTLLTIFEYRTMLSAALWKINAFDQHGVELGKKLVNSNEPEKEFDLKY